MSEPADPATADPATADPATAEALRRAVAETASQLARCQQQVADSMALQRACAEAMETGDLDTMIRLRDRLMGTAPADDRPDGQ